MAVLAGCEHPNNYLIHPREPAPDVVTWQADFGRDQLWVHLEGARPPSPGPFPTVLVLPEEWAGKRTISYVDPADAEKPKTQRPTVYSEQPVVR